MSKGNAKKSFYKAIGQATFEKTNITDYRLFEIQTSFYENTSL